ncbi:MAG: NIPSNAP family protein, partial [Ginsengibacter sp.]
AKDAGFMTEGQSFTNASADDVPYERMETILLEAFPGQAHLVIPLKKEGRIFELRSYESPTENLHVKKMDMFNTGGEIPLFNRLGFNPIFYGKVIAGGKMPNFMYMPIFDNLEQRTEQWKTFGNDPVWKDISTRPENENKVSVSHIDSIVMQAAEYSDI